MRTDPIVEETRAVREAYAAQYDFDLDTIYQKLKDQEQHSDRDIVSLPPKRSAQPLMQSANTPA